MTFIDPANQLGFNIMVAVTFGAACIAFALWRNKSDE